MKETYIDLDEIEAKWLVRYLSGYGVFRGVGSDYAFSILCKLRDSMRANGMKAQNATGVNQSAMMGTDEKMYAEEGRRYYRKAAWAQIAIGVGSVLQALVLAGILYVLATGVAHANDDWKEGPQFGFLPESSAYNNVCYKWPDSSWCTDYDYRPGDNGGDGAGGAGAGGGGGPGGGGPGGGGGGPAGGPGGGSGPGNSDGDGGPGQGSDGGPGGGPDGSGGPGQGGGNGK